MWRRAGHFPRRRRSSGFPREEDTTRARAAVELEVQAPRGSDTDGTRVEPPFRAIARVAGGSEAHASFERKNTLEARHPGVRVGVPRNAPAALARVEPQSKMAQRHDAHAAPVAFAKAVIERGLGADEVAIEAHVSTVVEARVHAHLVGQLQLRRCEGARRAEYRLAEIALPAAIVVDLLRGEEKEPSIVVLHLSEHELAVERGMVVRADPSHGERPMPKDRELPRRLLRLMQLHVAAVLADFPRQRERRVAWLRSSEDSAG